MKESESEVAQSGPTVCHPVYNLPGSSLHGIFQARILELVAISFCRDLPDPGIEPWSPTLQADSSPSEPPGNPDIYIHICIFFFFCLFQILLPCRLLQSIEYISLCCAAGPCWLSYIVVYIYIYVNPKLLIYPPLPFVLWYFRYIFIMPVKEETEEMEGDRVSRKVSFPLNLLIS